MQQSAPDSVPVCHVILLALGLVLATFGLRAESPSLFRVQPIWEELTTGLEEGNERFHPEEATIRRAMDDLESPEVERRVGALMLLGKYEHPVAQQALYNALVDSEVRARRAALISILEQPSALMRPDISERMMRMLGDPDPEIRRQISSILPRLISAWRMTQPRLQQPGTPPPSLPTNMMRHFLDAFGDEEAVVRRNMVANYHALPIGDAGPPRLLHAIADDDRQVRLRALRLASGIIRDSETFLQAALANPRGEDPLWDRELARQLGRHSHPDSFATLQDLAESEDRETALEAMASLFQLDPRVGADAPIMRILATERVPEGIAQRTLRLLYRIDGHEAWEIVASLLQAPSGAVRAEAVTLWLNLGPDYPDIPTVLQLLDDQNSEVWARVLSYLRSTANQTPPAMVKAIASHSRVEVRESVFHHLRHHETSVLEEILFGFLIDENQSLRQRALLEIANRQLRGWERVVRATLRDPDPALQVRAAEIILRQRDPEGLDLLRQHRERQPDSPLAEFLRSRNFPPSRTTNPPGTQ